MMIKAIPFIVTNALKMTRMYCGRVQLTSCKVNHKFWTPLFDKDSAHLRDHQPARVAACMGVYPLGRR